MPNGDDILPGTLPESRAPTAGFPVPIQTPEAEELLRSSRGILDRQNARELKPVGAESKLKESIGEYGAERYVEQNFRSRVKSRLRIPRRGQKGPPILDLVFEFDSGEILVLEAKQGSNLGKVNQKRFAMGDVAPEPAKLNKKWGTRRRTREKNRALRQTIDVVPDAVEQFSPRWFQDRIKEIRKTNQRLANRLERAWYDGKITARVIYVDADGMVENVLDATDEWRLFKQRAIPAESTRTPDLEKLKSPAKPKPGAKVQTSPQRGAGSVPAETDVVSGKPQLSDAAVGKTSTIKQPGKAFQKGHKIALKIGAGFLLEIGVGLLDSWFEGQAMKDDWKRIQPEVNRQAQIALDKAEKAGEISKFRTGENLEKGFQLYFRISLKVNTKCQDGFFGYSAYFESFELKSVDVVRRSANGGFPETGVNVACGEQKSATALYSPLFENAVQIESGSSAAADERFDRILGTVKKSYTASREWKSYLMSFSLYTEYFKDSKAATIWAELGRNRQFQKVLVGLGIGNPWDLYETGIPFEEIIETVPWIAPGLDEMSFMEEFLTFAEKWASPGQKTSWKKYYDKLADFRLARKCHKNCHSPNERMTNDRLLLVPPDVNRATSLPTLQRFGTP